MSRPRVVLLVRKFQSISPKGWNSSAKGNALD